MLPYVLLLCRLVYQKLLCSCLNGVISACYPIITVSKLYQNTVAVTQYEILKQAISDVQKVSQTIVATGFV